MKGFQQDLADCSGIICNAGFELASEALQLGKKILVKSLPAQMEQTSSTAALDQLGYETKINALDVSSIEQWLHEAAAIRVVYPNTAKFLVQWIQDGMPPVDTSWCQQIWSKVQVFPEH